MRPAFIALSELACTEDWCWNLACTTCGHMHFRYGLREIVRGKHPDNPDWFVHVRNHHELADVLGQAAQWRGSPAEQAKLIEIASAAPLTDLSKVSRFPDWLGHLGLVLWHTEMVERETRLITKRLVPQLVEMVPKGSQAAIHLGYVVQDDRRTLSWSDLKQVKRGLVSKH